MADAAGEAGTPDTLDTPDVACAPGATGGTDAAALLPPTPAPARICVCAWRQRSRSRSYASSSASCSGVSSVPMLRHRAMHRSIRLYPIRAESKPASRKIRAGDLPCRYWRMQTRLNASVYRILPALTATTAGRDRRYRSSSAVNVLSGRSSRCRAWLSCRKTSRRCGAVRVIVVSFCSRW